MPACPRERDRCGTQVAGSCGFRFSHPPQCSIGVGHWRWRPVVKGFHHLDGNARLLLLLNLESKVRSKRQLRGLGNKPLCVMRSCSQALASSAKHLLGPSLLQNIACLAGTSQMQSRQHPVQGIIVAQVGRLEGACMYIFSLCNRRQTHPCIQISRLEAVLSMPHEQRLNSFGLVPQEV